MEELRFVLPDFTSGIFPIEYTGRGIDISPEIVIENLSERAQTLAVTLEDVSHPIENFTHWVIWNIPAVRIVAKAIPAGKYVAECKNAVQGMAYGMHRYAGPKPPRGKTHTYRFTVYALDTRINLPAGRRKKHFLRCAEGHILQKGAIEYDFE